MSKLLLIGSGGFLGSVVRYLVSGWVQRLTGSAEFPYGTLAVNVLGCLVIGALSWLADLRGVFTPEARAFVFVGVLGGFTTFSTFGNESMALFRDGENLRGALYVGAHILFGLGAVWAGRALAALLWR
jgi:CrcB protein